MSPDFQPAISTFQPAVAAISGRKLRWRYTLWNTGNSQCIAVFRHSDEVTSARFDREEWRVLTASEDGTAQLWDISVDGTLSAAEHNLEFEVRSATMLDPDGQVRVLELLEWEERKQKLLEAEIRTGKAITASGTPHGLTRAELAAKRRQLAELKSRAAAK